MIRATLIAMLLLCTTAMMPQEHFVKSPLKVVSAHETTCMAQAIVREAPEESEAGKRAVGTVVINRVHAKGFPKTVCGVIYQKGQFSWTRLKLRKPDPVLYAKARLMAESVLAGHSLITIKKAVYFHNTSVQPNWDHVRLVQQIGNHIFYEQTVGRN